MYGIYVGLYVVASVAGSAGHLYHVPLLPPHVPIFLPIPSPSSSKYVQQWDHAWVTSTEGEGNDGHWDSGQKSHHILLPTHCYLAHAHPTMFCIHLVIIIGAAQSIGWCRVLFAMSVWVLLPPKQNSAPCCFHVLVCILSFLAFSGTVSSTLGLVLLEVMQFVPLAMWSGETKSNNNSLRMPQLRISIPFEQQLQRNEMITNQ